jgi:serine protease AprX
MSVRHSVYSCLVGALGVGAVLLASSPRAALGATEAAEDPVALRETEDPADVIHAAVLKEGKVVRYSAEPLSREAFSNKPFPRRKVRAPRDRPPGRIHPLLSRWLKERRLDDVEQVVVSFRDDIRIPRFPEPAAGESRDSPLNRKALGRAEELVRELEGKRRERYAKLTEELKARHRAEVLETFWLVSAVVVKLPLRAVPVLADNKEVLYLEPRFTLDEPPQNANNNDDVDDGRARMNSDPYFNLGLTRGFIGLLDTGMRFTHTQFNSPSNIDFRRDCVNGGATCNAGSSLNPNDDCWDHGTSSGAIITANANQGAAFRGVTAITLDSFKVYPTSFNANNLCNGGLDTAAMVRGFQRAVAVLDRVIVAEAQGSGDYLSSISIAADNAFDAGAVVIAANGNNGPNARTVNAPASAHKAIGTGNFDVQTQAAIASQSLGPTPDNRIKPDIQAPTNTETASNGCGWQQNCTAGGSGSDTAFRVFGGTSGSTPYASGAAALLRNWLRGTSSSIDPGQVYAQLILSGQTPAFNNTTGAGPLRLPTDGHAWWGKVNVTNGETIDIPLGVGGAPNTFDGALWWPETAFQFLGITFEIHNDVDLSLIDPSGTVRASSLSIPSVFERARVSVSVPTGTWKLRIRGYNVNGSQTVYWAAAAHRR